MAGVEERQDWQRGLVALCVAAILAGIVVGFIGGAFRWCLALADQWRLVLVEWAHGVPVGWLLPVVLAAAGAALAALIVTRVPLAAGSGIQHVEAVYRGESAPPTLLVLPAKFAGGLLAIGSGLVLGREGPTVHMGAVIGAETGRRARMRDDDVRLLQTSLAGAGLAVAFNAPIGGALFVFEEVTRKFSMRSVLPTLLAVGVAVACARVVIGDHPDFTVGEVASPSVALLPLFLVFGVVTGVLGVLYNRLVLGSLRLVDRVRRVPPVVKAAVIGGLVGAAMFIDPLAAGGGDTLSQLILGGDVLILPAIAGYMLVRFLAGPLSYAAGTPGGLFAPLLALGALWGVLITALLSGWFPGIDASLAIPFALVGMAAFFSAVVRAPFTGLAIVVEMTAVTSVTVPMLVATAAAALVAGLLRTPPVYDSLRERMLGHGPPPD